MPALGSSAPNSALRAAKAARAGGFTLLEVMVAVVILAVGLSALFTSEAGAIRIAQRARTTTVASLLARCKMGEIEERIAKEGWPASDLNERDGCCEEAEHDGFTCEWTVQRIVLPDLDASEDDSPLAQLKESAGDTDPAAAVAGAAAAAADPAAGSDGTQPASPSGPSSEGAPTMGIPLAGLGGLLGGGGAGGGGDSLAAMAMDIGFPILKPVIEEQVRRTTVIVRWKEGSKEQSFDIVQYLVNELPLVLPEEDEEADPNASGGGSGTGSATGTGSGTGSGSGGGATGGAP